MEVQFRITVYENGANGGSKQGKVIGVNFSYSMDDLLSKIGLAFNTRGCTRLFTSNGGEITEVNLLRDEEVTYVSKGEDYIPPEGSKDHEDSKLVKLSFGGHSVFMTHSTLQSHTPVSIIMKCHGSELAIAYERDAEVTVDRAAAQTEGVQLESAVGDADSLDAGTGVGVGPFSQEVIERILLELPTKDLLSSRLVSRIWKAIATSLCRGRHVQLRRCWYDAPNGLEIFSLFDLHNLPWSAYVFDRFPKNISAMHRKFLELFGPHLWEVKFGGNWDFASVLTVLRSTPNLQKLEFLPETNSWLRLGATDQVGKLNLPKLKQLKLDLCDEEADFLQFLLHATNDGLDSIEIQTNKMDGDGKMAELLGRILRQVPHIGITLGNDIHGNFLTVLGEQFLPIRKLELFLREPKADGSNHVELFRPIERLLDRLDNLEELKLSVIQDADGFSKASFTFPNRMDSLRTLSIHFSLFLGRQSKSKSTNFVSSILSTLQPDQVPMLEKVIISTPLCYSCYRNPGNVTIFNSAYRFDSVRVLTLKDSNKHYLKDDWSQVFPNVRSLDVQCHSGFIAYVFTKMDHLEHLTLRVLDEDGVNGLLCGIPEPDGIYQLPEDVIKQLRFSYARPSLLNLTKLRSLVIEPLWGALLDSGVTLSILQMQPLESLILRGDVEITEELELKLEERHYQVTVGGIGSYNDEDWGSGRGWVEDDDEQW